MVRFIEMTDHEGKAVLVNLDRVTTVTFDNGKGTVSMLTADGTVELPMTSKEEFLRKQQDESGTMERISGNLFHIWEILRARLH